MPLNKGYPTKNTIMKPKVNHHTLHSLSCGLAVEGFMLTEIDSKLAFKITYVNNLQSLFEFIHRGIIGTRIETLFRVRHTEIIGVPTIDGAIIMVCVWEPGTYFPPIIDHGADILPMGSMFEPYI
jgi:hypothetical protein